MKSLIVIPARMGSTRFPGKPLAVVAGLSMIKRVWLIAKAIKGNNRIIVASDKPEQFYELRQLGAEVLPSPEECASGSDRAAFVFQSLAEDFDAVVSLQGDAVLTPPWVVEDVLNEMKKDSKVEVTTPAVAMSGQRLDDFLESKKRGSSTGTSVVINSERNALYFSKMPIPFLRERNSSSQILRHIGTYAYRPSTIKKFTSLEVGTLEKAEGLEQLRLLENGISIRVVLVDYKGRTHASIDNPEDVEVVEKIIAKEGELV
jgi:3-deoxy-manno-octulosonate cytidylyltransferase (CMP-KDO synthetase)